MAARDDAVRRGLQVMPKSSVKFKSVLVKSSDKLVQQPLTCFRCPLTFTRIKELQQHLIQAHPLIAIFACNFCLKGFLSVKALTSHVCANFNMLVAQRVASGEPVLMSVAVHTVICADCGLQVPILGTVMEAYSSFIKSHMTSQLQSVVSYFVDFPSEVTLRNRLIEIDYSPTLENVPTQCGECQLEYESTDDIEAHAHSAHDIPPKQCPVCSQYFYTNLMLRDHMLSIHLNDPASVVAFLDAVSAAPMK
uniref:C2H2-type domain-containing protein n=1 Tax=Plectus sambesii TaxID=2011161 RepID=A0A914UU61_9BILA